MMGWLILIPKLLWMWWMWIISNSVKIGGIGKVRARRNNFEGFGSSFWFPILWWVNDWFWFFTSHDLIRWYSRMRLVAVTLLFVNVDNIKNTTKRALVFVSYAIVEPAFSFVLWTNVYLYSNFHPSIFLYSDLFCDDWLANLKFSTKSEHIHLIGRQRKKKSM